jgi:hypothetical protein
MYGPGAILPLGQTPEEAKKRYDYWQSEIDRAEKRREEIHTNWKVQENIERYTCAADPLKVNVGADFSDAERKKAGLLFDTPTVAVLPDAETHPTAAALHQDLMNELLSERQVNAKATALKAILANLTVIQPAPTKIGYEPTVSMGMGPMGPAPTVVHEDWYWTKLSERSLLLPVDLRDTDYDRSSPWVGYRWRMPVSRARRVYEIPPEVKIPSADGAQKLYFTDEEVAPAEDADDPICTGVYLEYKAALVDPTVVHPAQIRCLAFVDGLETPVKHKDAAWQIDPMGNFNPAMGFKGFSIHLLALRDLPDSSYVPADSTITSHLTNEINDFLTDMKRQRESNRLAVLYDPSKLTPEAKDRIEEGKAPGFIPVKPDSLMAGKDTIMQQVAQLGSGREHYLGLDVFQSARERILGISANTVGAEDEGDKTATEISAVTRNTEARFEQERQRVIEWYLAGVQKLSSLVVRYGDRLAVEVLGPQRGAQWVQARNAGQLGPFRFDVMIDGGKYLDVQAERKQWLDFYNQTAKDPNARRTITLKKLAQSWGLDPTEFVVEELPEPKPEPPKIAVSVSAVDLNPSLPHFPVLVEVLRQGGLSISPDAIMLAQQQAMALGQAGRSPVSAEQEQKESPDPENPMQVITSMMPPKPVPVAGAGPDPKQMGQPEHGGAAEAADRISQHQMAKTGNRSGPPA